MQDIWQEMIVTLKSGRVISLFLPDFNSVLCLRDQIRRECKLVGEFINLDGMIKLNSIGQQAHVGVITSVTHMVLVSEIADVEIRDAHQFVYAIQPNSDDALRKIAAEGLT